jgi:DNA polymerase-3 subunit delta'
MITQSEEFHKLDKLNQHHLLQYTLAIMRETLLTRSGATALLHEGTDEKFIQDFSKVMTVGRIERTNALVTEAGLHLERNGSAKMIFLDLSLQLSRIMTGTVPN